jgi:hypothetical protein
MKRFFSILSGLLVLSATLTAWAAGDRASGSTSPPIISWQAPAFYTSPPSGRTALNDLSSPMPFVPVTPCRQYDSRSPNPPLPDATARTVTLTGVPCGIPTTAVAVAVNITVLDIIGAGSNGVLKVGTSAPPPTSWINYPFTETQRANAGVLPLTGAGAIVVQVNQGAGSVDFIVDVFGYYGPTPANTNNTFTVILPNATTAIFGESLGGGVGVAGHSSGASGFGVYGTNDTGFGVGGLSSGAGGVGVYGYNNSASGFGVWANNGPGIGVYGNSTSSYGVLGSSTTNVGVKGTSSAYNGVWAQSTNWDALYAVGGINGTYSVGARNGVVGITTATTGDNHGVVGYDSTGNPSASNYGTNSGGLFFSSTGFGVQGASRWIGIAGQFYNGSGAYVAEGLLGTNLGTAFDSALGPWGVFSQGNFGASGAKHFVEPHPTDPKKDILYSSLEGRVVGTYFCGTASIVNHEAVIVIPEDFRIVTAEEGLTVQVTPIGAYSQVYVESQDLNQVVIRGSRDVQFHYMVNGVRRAFKNFEPVQTGYIFMPQSPSDRMPLYLTEEAKARLISNGTYNPDGTVNMTTAERAGFTRIWADREAEAKAAAEKNAKAKAGQQQ